jgi:hypothetical protein
MKITKTTADDIRHTDRLFKVFDDKLKGFGLLVRPSGRKVFIYDYRTAGGGSKTPTRRETLGDASKLTAEEARGIAKAIAAKVLNGADPRLTAQNAKPCRPCLSSRRDT